MSRQPRNNPAGRLSNPEQRLAWLRGQLRQYRTARDIADAAGLSRVQAYRWLAAARLDLALETSRVRRHATGPTAVAYRLARGV